MALGYTYFPIIQQSCVHEIKGKQEALIEEYTGKMGEGDF